jgi:predicted Rossmann-fold nucleotide-binding protein
MNQEYHGQLMKYVDRMIERGTVSPDDKNLFHFTDSIDEAVEYLRRNTIDSAQLKVETERWRPFRWFFER